MRSIVALCALTKASCIFAYDATLGFNSRPIIESRSIDDIHQAALQEGGIVTAWHGGDEENQQGALKKAFEERFPGVTLNITVDLSKYHDGLIDEQLANKNLYVDSAILQTVHDYPRWKEEGALLNYAPLGFDKIHPSFRDIDAAFYGVRIFGWSGVWNTKKWDSSKGPIQNFADFLNPELRNRIVLTYPNDDDAVLYAFDLVMQQLGSEWLESLLAQNPLWVRGSATPTAIISQSNNSYVASFIGGEADPSSGLNTSFPTDAPFVTWPQTAAIFKDAPHPEGAKLLHNFLISKEWLESSKSWTVRTDAPPDYPNIFDTPGTNPTVFQGWMANRNRVERLRFWFEKRLGTAQGLSPLDDNI
ncbi:periplasmic binding protein-like II [Zopfia rhizophila CBS 207.26]|uniref:Periplasmic binding protein-like II n=1 Tax=Zopfia rhizophila CBS 207.26 TaxID=1314779 RepID=A0A6A6EL44_9PEZI|nr:periplasmic binding protein-like II [Zopfia rhizophila CBS 207.26]